MATIPTLSNEELIVLARKGDEWAQHEFFNYNQRLAYHIAHKFLSSHPNLDDLVGYANIGLVKAYNSFNTELGIKFATYASRVMENEILMFLRKARKHQGTVSLEDPLNTDQDGNVLTLLDVMPDPEDVESVIECQDVLYSFERFCSALSERDREIAHRVIFEEENQRDVADAYGISQSYVSRIVKRMKRQFRLYLDTGRLPSQKRAMKVKTYTA